MHSVFYMHMQMTPCCNMQCWHQQASQLRSCLELFITICLPSTAVVLLTPRSLDRVKGNPFATRSAARFLHRDPPPF